MQGTVSKLIIAIQDDTVSPPEPLEHFVFDIEYLIDPLTTFATSGRDERYVTVFLRVFGSLIGV